MMTLFDDMRRYVTEPPRMGERGDAVRALQVALRDHGIPVGAIDGAAGHMTRGASSPYDRVQMLAEVSSVYNFGVSGGSATITGSDTDTEHDIAFFWDGTTQRAYYNSPDPAQDDAVPDPDGSGSGTPSTTTTSTIGTYIVVNLDASTPSLVIDGAYTIALNAIP